MKIKKDEINIIRIIKSVWLSVLSIDLLFLLYLFEGSHKHRVDHTLDFFLRIFTGLILTSPILLVKVKR